jgi:hypothetical protein
MGASATAEGAADGDLTVSEPTFPGVEGERIQVVVTNEGNETSPPATVEVVVHGEEQGSATLRNETGAIEPGGYDIVEVRADTPTTGLVEAEAHVDPDNEVDETDETNNAASRAYLATPSDEGPPANHVFFESENGSSAAGDDDVRVQDGRLTLSAPDDADQALVDRAWLLDRLGTVGAPAAFDLQERADRTYVVVDAEVLSGESVAFEPTDLREDDDLHTIGHQDTILLEERSMRVHVDRVPSYERETRTIETENGTEEYRTPANATERIAINFTAENTTGQPIHVDASWLEEHGITSPTFEHEDGTEVRSYRNGDHYVVVPEHFSYLYTWNDEGAWDREVDQSYSQIYWNVTDEHKVTVEADRRDSGDEIYSNDYRSTVDTERKFSISGEWTVDQQGNWQNAYPLAITDGATTDVDSDPPSFYVKYRSRDSNLDYDQHYIARFLDENGDSHTLFRYENGQVSTKYTFELSYDAGHRELRADIWEAGSWVAGGTHSLSSGESLGFDKTVIATRGASNSEEDITRGHVDNVQVELEDNQIGEVGATSLSDDTWGVESATIGDLVPRVFGTTQTVNGQQDPSQVHVTDIYNGNDGDFEIQHCEWDQYNLCDGHASEDVGWVVFDRGENRLPVKGMYFSTKSTSDGVAEDEMKLRYYDRIQNTPLVFAQTTTTEDGEAPRNVQVMNVGTDIATIEFCQQDTSDGCDTHASENVEGWAIDPQLAERGHTFDWGTVSVSDSGWEPITFDGQDFQDPPVVISMVQTENGGQEALYSEVKDVTATGAQVRYCEGYDDYDSNNVDEDNCDNHATETVAWVAIRNRDDGEVWMDTDQAAEACFTTTTSELTVDVDGSCTDDDHSPLKDLQFRWDWENDGYWDTNWLSSPTASHTYSSGGEYWIRMQVKDEAADVDDAYRSVEVNEPPVASFTGTTDGLTLDVNASDSYDNDGDSLTYEWDWDDGTSDTTTSETYSHTYDVCPDGTFTVVLTVTDGNGGSDTDKGTFYVEDNDDDGDSLYNCRETGYYGTDPNDIDTDNDEFRDDEEVNNFEANVSDPQDAFCGADGCNYPDPTTPDLYLELDGWIECTSASDCQVHRVRDLHRDRLEDIFSNGSHGDSGGDSNHGPHNVRINADTGIGDGGFGPERGGGQLIGGADASENFDNSRADANDAWSLTGLWEVSAQCPEPDAPAALLLGLLH